jgi:hypothetical protein
MQTVWKFAILLPVILIKTGIGSAVEPHSSSSDYDHSYIYQRKSQLPNKRLQTSSTERSQIDERSSTARERSRRSENSKDLKKLIQELEESDYGSYGSWGNFRSRKLPRSSEPSSESSAPIPGSGVFGDAAYQSPFERDGGPLDFDYYQIQEYEDVPYWENQNQRRLLSQQMIPATSSPPFTSMPIPTHHIAEQQILRESYDPQKILRFRSVLKLTGVVVTFMVLSYLAVSPRSLPLIEYNQAYKENLLRVAGSIAGPLLMMTVLQYGSHANINDVIGRFVSSCTIGYVTLVAVEFVIATIVKLALLR